jgi:hypothetical protein
LRTAQDFTLEWQFCHEHFFFSPWTLMIEFHFKCVRGSPVFDLSHGTMTFFVFRSRSGDLRVSASWYDERRSVCASPILIGRCNPISENLEQPLDCDQEFWDDLSESNRRSLLWSSQHWSSSCECCLSLMITVIELLMLVLLVNSITMK